MEILIPVTKVLKSEKSELRTQKIMSQRVQSQKSISKRVQKQKTQDKNQNQKKVKKSVKWKITQEKDEKELIQQKQSKLQKQKNIKLNFQTQTEQQFKKHHQKIQCELQKKSTRSSLNEIPDHLNHQYQNQSQLSHNNIIIKKEMLSYHVRNRNQYSVKFHNNQVNELDEIYCCKICLQQGNSNLSVQNQQNILIRVCKCHDYVHIHCLEEWINHRDILNQNIQANQCQVCRQHYTISLNTEYFFSFKILKRNFRKQPLTVAKKFFLVFFSFLISIFGLYLLIALFAQSGQNGGSIRQILGMPYVTCVTIIIFLLFIVLLIFGIFTYTFVSDLCLDFKYKIQKITQQQQSSRNLQTLFTEWK